VDGSIDDLPTEVVVDIVLAGDDREGELREGMRVMAAEARAKWPQGWVAHLAEAYRQADRTLYAERLLAELRGQTSN
jgi:hypothetical protein